MANEDILRQRWDEIYHNSDEYQSAAKRAAIDAAKRNSDYAQQRLQPMGVQQAGALARRELLTRGTSPGEVTLRGLDDYQRKRENDYIERARTRGAEEVRNSEPSVAHGPGWADARLNPDFAGDQPWVNVTLRQPRMPMGHAPAIPRPVVERGVSPDLRAQEKARGAEAARTTTENIRREMTMRQALPTELAGAPSLFKPGQKSVYDLLNASEKNEILRLPPEEQQARLAGHPLRKLAGKPMGPAPGIQDYLGGAQEAPRAPARPTADLIPDNGEDDGMDDDY